MQDEPTTHERPPYTYALKLDSEQFEWLRAQTREQTVRFWSIDNTIKLLQIAAILIGAVWTIHTFVRFGRTNEELTLQSQRLSTTGQEVINKINDLELVHKQQFDQLQSELSIAQQRASLDQTRLSTELNAISIKSGQRDLFFNGKGRLAIDDQLVLHKRSSDDNYNYVATLKFKMTNLSKGDTEVSRVEIWPYLGTIQTEALRRSPVVKVNTPMGNGPISWRRFDIITYVCEVCTVNSRYTPEDYAGPGPTGVLRSGESNVFEYDYLVAGRPEQYIGFIVNIITDEGRTYAGKSLRYPWLFSEVEQLATSGSTPGKQESPASTPVPSRPPDDKPQ